MPDLELHQYPPVNPVLRSLIKHYWFLRSSHETAIHGRLIPTNNIDLIINLASPVTYQSKGREESFRKAHFNGIHNHYRMVSQTGMIDLIGITFHPAGFYPLAKTPVAEFANNIILVDNILPGFESNIEKIAASASTANRITILEEMLMQVIDLKLLPGKNHQLLIHNLLQQADPVNIHDYCQKHGISQRTMERFFYKYIGTTPKAFLLTTRFRNTVKKMIAGDFDSMTQVGYEFNYYDQTHFINSFKALMGTTPAKQHKEQDLILNRLPKR